MRQTRDDLRRLHFINALFANLTGNDLYLAHQIKEAITFSLSELEAQMEQDPDLATRFDSEFNAAAARVLQKLFNGLPHQGFFHWDAARTLHSATPLFARAELITGLKQLAPYREATHHETNLRPALLPAERRRTATRLRDYDEALSFVRDLASARKTRSSNLQLLFL